MLLACLEPPRHFLQSGTFVSVLHEPPRELGVLFAEINSADIFIGADFIGRAFEQGFALEEDAGAVNDVEGFSYAVIGDENANAAFFEISDQL